ncbi:MAG: threonylcarbamoyl-AMP synthase [Phycisphaerales bacterium]|nr:MAG: threonylcarbamoyl-AMP synthase [Phycisphaerales bacterium]
MKTNVAKIDPANMDQAALREAAELVEGGALVAFPTETVYGIACRADSNALARLTELKGRTAEKHFTLHIGEKNAVDEYVPAIGVKARKLIQNSWPGPLTIVFELDGPAQEQLRGKFERDVFESLYKQDSIGIRCPDHPVAAALLQQTSTPVVAPSANLAGEAPAVNALQVLAQLSGRIEMVLDAGPSKFGTSSTVVKIGKKGLQMLRRGVYSQEQVEKFSHLTFLFVCTGNTCRSPMAEGVFRKYLAEKLQCHVDGLSQVGYKIHSAGTIGSSGFPATGEAVAACAAKGIDISAHRNEGLSEELIEESDFIYAMEQVHLRRILALEPEAAGKCMLLTPNKGIPDPMGHSQEAYNRCLNIIEKGVKKRIGELVV